MTMTPDICVIGAGSAGLTVAAAAASFGLKVVLVERALMGGDCLNVGCVPSKSLIAAARHAQTARDGAAFGVHAEPKIDFAAVNAHVHGVIAGIAPHDSVERFEQLGVTVLRTDARFVDADTLDAGGVQVKARRFVIATGSRPIVPPIDGLADCRPLTNESVFDLKALPARLAVIGGGAVGIELAQAFVRLGSEVTVIEGGTILGKADPEAVSIIRDVLVREGVRVIENVAVEKAARADEVMLTLADGTVIEADEVLVAVGRTPGVAGLGLDEAGVKTSKSGVEVDHGMRTSNRRIYAIGDVVGGLQFTHVAGHQASLAVRAIVFKLPVRYNPDQMPRCIYTAPELAQVGLTEHEARARDPRTTTTMALLSGNDRAQTERATEGFVKLVLSRRGKLVGATIVAPHAGELAATYALALAAKVKLSTIASFVPPYPTTAEAGKRAATHHFAKRLDKRWIRAVLGVLKRF